MVKSIVSFLALRRTQHIAGWSSSGLITRRSVVQVRPPRPKARSSGNQFPELFSFAASFGTSDKISDQERSRRESDVHEGRARGDTLGVPPKRPERPGGVPATAPFPDPREPVSLAEDGGGGRARRDRDAGPGRAHALRARRGQRQVRGALPPHSGGGRGGGPGADRLARLGRRPAGRPGGAREDGGGQARGGAGGVGRPKSTRPGLFDQHGEVAGGGAGPRAVPARGAQGRDGDALDPQEHLPRPGGEGRQG